MTWRLPDTYHSAGHGRGTATLKFYEGRDNLLRGEVTVAAARAAWVFRERPLRRGCSGNVHCGVAGELGGREL